MGEATDSFAGIRAELEAQNRKILENGFQTFAVKTVVQAVQQSFRILYARIDRINKILPTMTESMKHIPSCKQLRQHQATVDEEFPQVEEMNTGLTTRMEQYKFSESSPFEFR